MTSQLAQELMQSLNRTGEAARQMTIKVDGEVIGVLDKYRAITTTEKGKTGRLEPYGETTKKLILFADECLAAMSKQKPDTVDGPRNH